MDIIPIQCPHCLGELEVNWDAGTAICLYCRGKMVIKQPFDHTKRPYANLMRARFFVLFFWGKTSAATAMAKTSPYQFSSA